MAGTKRGMPFERTGPFPIDDKFVLSNEEMLAVDDQKMPEKYLAVCKDDGKLYTYDKSATPDDVTGKFSKVSGTEYTAGQGIRIENETIDTPLLDRQTEYTLGNYNPFLDNVVTKADYKSPNYIATLEYPSSANMMDKDFTKYLWVAEYVDGTKVVTEYRNRTVGLYGVSYDIYYAFTGEPYYSQQGQSVPSIAYVTGTYFTPGQDSIDQNPIHPRLAKITAYDKAYVRNLSAIVAQDYPLEKLFNGATMSTIEKWGVARTGSVRINMVNKSGSQYFWVGDLGFASNDDYVVLATIKNGDANGWGLPSIFITNKTVGEFHILVITDSPDVQYFDVNYAIIGKGYGAQSGGGGTGTVDTEMSDTSENAVQNKAIKAYVDGADAELQRQKATGYFERTDYPITLDTVGQPFYALARDVFTVEIENHKPYTYEFTASDVYDLKRYNETTGKTFVVTNEDNETIYITMKGALPDNVQYVAGSANPVVDLTNATATLTKTTFLQQIDDMLIPRTSGEVFVFDVDSDQFTEDPVNPDDKHVGMTIDSPTFDEIMDNLVTGKIVFVRMCFNGGNSYDFYQLNRESNDSIGGHAFDLEFPQGHIWYYDIYIQKRGLGTNATTYFGVFADKVVDGGGGGGGTVDQSYNAYSTNAQSGTAVAEAIANMASYNADTSPAQYNGVVSHGNDSLAFTLDTDTVGVTMASPSVYYSNKVLPTKDYVDGQTGDLSALTTTAQTDLVSAINEVKFGLDNLGEPFRVKQWASNTLNVEIPYCTEDIGNTSIQKMTFTIDDVEGADYQIVGMISYELFDAASGGNRINAWPVCQFTGNGQKELGVRWMCGGTTRKTAKRISAWVLLKHR